MRAKGIVPWMLPQSNGWQQFHDYPLNHVPTKIERVT
jgi:hypothetical protein